MNTIYIDMDGVVADFNRAAREYLNKRYADQARAEQQGRWPEHEWGKIRELPHFYRDLPKTHFADRIIELARGFRDKKGWQLYMLTAIPKNNDMPHCFHDKIDWMQEYYPDVRVHFGPYSHDKQHHCRPGDILVDDRESNTNEWRAAGGIAVRVLASEPERALAELEALLLKQ